MMWRKRSRSTKQQPLVLGRIGRGWWGSSLLLRSTSCQDVDTVPPPPPSAEFDPRADVLLRRSSMGADLRVCVAVLHHATISARELNSPLVRSVLSWCSAKLGPPLLCRERFISQALSRVCGRPRLEFLCTGAPHQLAGTVESLASQAVRDAGVRRGQHLRLISLPKPQLRPHVSVHAQER